MITQPNRFIIGTYTGDQPGDSQGLYLLQTDKNETTLIVPMSNPSYVVQHPQHRNWIYAVSEQGGEGVRLSMFDLDQMDAQGTVEPSFTTNRGGGPAHLAAYKDWLAVAHYGDGALDVYRLDAHGHPSQAIAYIKHEGHGPRADRQEQAHTHWVGFVLDQDQNPYAVDVVDLGIDAILRYKLDDLARQEDPSPMATLQLKPGSGPRHLAQIEDDIYLLTELHMTIEHIKDHGDRFEWIESYALANESEMADLGNTAAAIDVSPNGQVVLATVRGLDRIFTFDRNHGTGSLTPMNVASTSGQVPREAKFISDETLMVANQESHSIHQMDVETLTIEASFEVQKPVCILPI